MTILDINKYQKKLRTLLILLNVSQEQLGDSLGITRQTINSLTSCRYEMSKIQFIAIETTLKEYVGEKRYYEAVHLVLNSNFDARPISEKSEKTSYYTIADISERLNVNPETVRRWIRNGKLKAKLSRSKKEGFKISEASYKNFIKNNPKYF